MGPLLTRKVIGQCREAREAARRDEFDAGKFREALEELRVEVHRTLDQLREVSFAEHAARRLFRRTVDCFTGVCGCAVVGIDASALAATAGILGPWSAISGAVGCAMMGQAITDLSDAGRGLTAAGRGLTAWHWLKRFCHRVVYGVR